MTTEKLDFMPGEARAARALRNRIRQGFVVAVGLLGAVVGVAFSQHIHNAGVEAKVAHLRESVASMSEWEDQAGSLADKLETARKKHESMVQLVRGSAWNRLLADLAAATSGHSWLTQCTIVQEPDPASQDEDARISTMRISGVAASDLDLIGFTSKLTSSSCVEDLRLDMSRKSTDTQLLGMVEFEMFGLVQ